MARQPIYDRDGAVYAYELLYRSAGMQAGLMTEESEAQALANTLVEIGLERLAADRLAFINVPESLLLSEALLLLPKDRVVLELLETLQMNDSTRSGIAKLRQAGYTVAFDDFVFEEKQYEFVPSVSLVKVDVLDTPAEVIRKELPRLKAYGVKLLAEKVEDKAMHRRCMSWGFDYFQGYYYARPETLESRGIAPRQQVMLSLLAKLQDPDASLAEIERLVNSDPSIALRLLKLVNSVAMGLKVVVSSVKVALAMMGLSKVQALASLLAMSSGSDSNTELMAMALVRARMCERIAQVKSLPDPNRFFTAGLFSVLDALLDTPMHCVVENIPLDAELREALLDLGSNNPVAHVLRSALAFERGDWGRASVEEDLRGIAQIYWEATEWARDLEQEIKAA